ncbi:MAG: DMT family transporter [Chloroflexi bacterium]|nr:DMT family transporter [Chloroflexota bacterium]
MNNKKLGILAGLTAASIWGGMYVVSKVVLDVIPPFVLLALRLSLGIITLGAIVVWRGNARITRQQLMLVLGVGIIGYGVSMGFQFVGTKMSTASNGAVITSATPAFVFLFAHSFLGEKISKRGMTALLLSTTGVLAVLDPRSVRLAPDLFWGNLLLAAAAITWALYSVLVRKVTQDVGVLHFSLFAFIGGIMLVFPISAWELGMQEIGKITYGIVAGLLYLGIISTAFAAYLWNKAFEVLEASLASLTLFAQPVVGATLGVLFLGEQITPLLVIGGGLIGLGLWLASTEDFRSRGV